MLPSDVDIAAEVEHHAIALGEIDQVTRACVPEGELSGGPKGHTDRTILKLCPLLIKRPCVVMKWLPISSIPIPIEACGARLRRNGKISAHLVHNLLVHTRLFRI